MKSPGINYKIKQRNERRREERRERIAQLVVVKRVDIASVVRNLPS